MNHKDTSVNTARTALKKATFWVFFVVAVGLYGGALVLEVSQVMSGTPAEDGEQHVDFPQRSITIVAPGSPGGGWDQLARVLQHILIVESISSEPVEVVNRGGAGGTIGLAELITQHRADPYTLMVGGSTLVSALVMNDSRFNLGQVTLLARLASEYDVIAVPYDSPIKDFGDLVAKFKAEPERFIWGGGSAGSVDHLLVALIAKAADIDPTGLNYVAYAGGGEAAAAVMGNQVTAGVAGYAEWKDLAAANKMRLLAISSPGRLPGVDIPTIREFGLGAVLENWRFLVAPPGIGVKERSRLLEMITSVRNSEEWRKVLERYSWEDSFLTGPELNQFIADETASTARLLGDIGLGVQGEGFAKTGPYFFPVAILILLVLLAGALAAQHRHRISAVSREFEKPPVTGSNDPISWRKFVHSAGLILIYVVALKGVGFYFATPPYIVFQAQMMGGVSLRNSFSIAVFFTIAVYLLFEKLLFINVP